MSTSNPVVFYDQKGEVKFTCSVDTQSPEGLTKLVITPEQFEALNPGNNYVINGEVLDRGVKPSTAHYWDWPTFTWVLDLSLAKTQAKLRITKARDKEEISGFLAFGKVFDSDPTAVQRISVGVQAANAVGESFSVDWTCKDNTTITLDYWMVLALPTIMADAANTLHTKARGLKGQIDTATTLSEIESIVW